jgi:hypothetical protein
VPTDDVLLILIRSSLIALNQANVTGNYSVLRDIGAPDFKQANGADRLAQPLMGGGDGRHGAPG